MVGQINKALGRVPSWAIFAAGVLWAGLLVWRAGSDALGPDPVAALTDRTGMLALQCLIIGLWLTPVQRRTGLRVGRFKRVVGLGAFFFASVHLAVWAALDLGLRMGMVVEEIWKRPFLALGMAAFVLLVPLAATSFNRAIKALGGPRWRRLHQLVYPAAVVAVIHFALGSKVWEGGHLVWAVLLALALVERLVAWWERPAHRKSV